MKRNIWLHREKKGKICGTGVYLKSVTEWKKEERRNDSLKKMNTINSNTMNRKGIKRNIPGASSQAQGREAGVGNDGWNLISTGHARTCTFVSVYKIVN